MMADAVASPSSGSVPNHGNTTRDRVMQGIAGCLGLMLMFCNMENNSRVGRVAFTVAAIGLSFWSLHVGWLGGRHLRRFLPPVVVVLAAMLASSIFSIDPGFSLNTLFRQHVWFLMLFLAVGAWSSIPRHQLHFLRGLLVAAGFASSAGVLLYYFAHDLQRLGYIGKASRFVYTAQDAEGGTYYRAAGLMESYTRSAMVYIIAMPAIVALFTDAWRKGRRIEMGACVVVFAMAGWYLLLTKARGAWLATGGACFLTMILLRYKWWLLSVLPILAVVALAVLPSERERALTLFRHLSDPNLVLSGRLELWSLGYRPIAENPLVGVGYGGNIFLTKAGIARYELRSVNHRQPDLHNLYLQTIAEVGILGAVAYAWFLLLVLRCGIRALRREWRQPQYIGLAPAMAAMAAMLVVGVVYYMNEDHVAQIWWATTGLIAGACARRKERQVP